MPTIFDVARAAGVGIATVSRVLNNSPLVSEATRARVLAAIEALRYQPNAAARAFARRRTASLELIVPLYVRASFLDILAGIQAALADTPYSLLVRTVESAADRDRALAACCTHAQADGALLVSLAPTPAFVERLRQAPFPVVLLNAAAAGNLWSVSVDHAAAAASAVAYCLGLGHERIGLVDRLVDPFDAASGGICQAGYARALAEAGRSSEPGYAGIWDFSAAGGAQAAAALMQLPRPPTAVVAGSDIQAIGVLQAARARGWRVPGDLSVVGYNDSEVAAFLNLTTVQLPLRELGQAAAQLLLDIVAEPGPEPTSTSTSSTTYLPTPLLRRGTCGAPNAS